MLILGLDNAGKTTLLEQLKSQFPLTDKARRNEDQKLKALDNIMPTVGQNVGHVKVANVLLKLWDVGGQENLRSLWDSYYEQAHAVVFVVDSCDRDRIEECRQTLDSIVSHESIEGAPILMLANKQDKEDHMEVEDIKEIFNKIAEKMSARDSRVLPVSALEGTGVAEAADWLSTRLVRNKEFRPPNWR